MSPTQRRITALGLIILIGAAAAALLGWFGALAFGTAASLAALIAGSISDRKKAAAHNACTRAERHWKAHWHRRLSHRKWRKRDV